MQRWLFTVLMMLALWVPLKSAQAVSVFTERAGPWRAACDRVPADDKVYCRIFYIETFSEFRGKNFVQFGPAWAPDQVGIVLATYLEFRDSTEIRIGVDKHERHVVPARGTNNIMLGPERAKPLMEQMATGNKMVVDFYTKSGVHHLALADLTIYKEMLKKVQGVMALHNGIIDKRNAEKKDAEKGS
ncbi:hypothetical protein [Magnetococcus sp. PR-3]|uniref:hypothetical protein n=1 Tax=Magnetococcus sp. PR-3 TaxID=3120355 RepID=UPI002FCDE8D8